MECRGFAVDAEWGTAMVAGWLAFGTGEGLLGYGTHFRIHPLI